MSKSEIGKVGTGKRGSPLEGECGHGHSDQTHGKSIGAGERGLAEHHKGHSMGGAAYTFRPPATRESHGFGHARHGQLRLSGHAGAHRVGKK